MNEVYEEPGTDNKKTRTIIIIVVVALVLLCCCCLAAIGIGMATGGFEDLLYNLGY